MADKNYLDSDGVLYLWQKIKAKITDAIKNKVDKEDGKGLSTNDYTTAEKTKLAGIADGANKYSHPTNSGNKHIPAGGSTGQILRWSADGTAAWGSDNNTTYSEMTGATASTDGKSGLVPTPAKGKQGQFLRGDGTWQTPANTTYSDMKGATTTAAGTHGLAPAPAAGAANRYLRSDGTWQVPPDNNTTYSDFKGATDSAAGVHGLVPAPTADGSDNLNRTVLLADGTWKKIGISSTEDDENVLLILDVDDSHAVDKVVLTGATSSDAGIMTATDKTKLDGIAKNANNYSHPTSSGNKHIPSGGSAGQILRWSADGTAVWGSDNNTTYSDMKGATSSAAGTHGLVPAPAAGKQGQYLRGDGTWATPTNTTYADATQSTHGLMSTTDKQKLDAYPSYSSIQSTYATKSEITNMYKYCGSVASADKLPTTGQRVGDVYNIETASTYGGAGMNVAWNGSAWDPLGEIFSISTITNTWMDTNLV